MAARVIWRTWRRTSGAGDAAAVASSSSSSAVAAAPAPPTAAANATAACAAPAPPPAVVVASSPLEHKHTSSAGGMLARMHAVLRRHECGAEADAVAHCLSAGGEGGEECRSYLSALSLCRSLALLAAHDPHGIHGYCY